MKAMIIKEFREMRRDRRTVAMLVVLPVLLLVMFGYAANFSVSSLRTVVVGSQASVAQAKLPPLFDVVSVRPDSGSAQAQDILKRGEAQVVLDTSTTPFTPGSTAPTSSRRKRPRVRSPRWGTSSPCRCCSTLT